jgi:predicted HicB family RNase H-like nuclease
MRSLTPEDARVSVQVRLPLTLRNRLATQATDRDVSLNQLINELLEKAIK